MMFGGSHVEKLRLFGWQLIGEGSRLLFLFYYVMIRFFSCYRYVTVYNVLTFTAFVHSSLFKFYSSYLDFVGFTQY